MRTRLRTGRTVRGAHFAIDPHVLPTAQGYHVVLREPANVGACKRERTSQRQQSDIVEEYKRVRSDICVAHSGVHGLQATTRDVPGRAREHTEREYVGTGVL